MVVWEGTTGKVFDLFMKDSFRMSLFCREVATVCVSGKFWEGKNVVLQGSKMSLSLM